MVTKWNIKIVFAALSLFLFFVACNNNNERVESVVKEQKCNPKLTDQFNWLIGNWANVTDKSAFYENWIVKDSVSISAESIMLINNDTVFSENILLTLVDGIPNYIVSVTDQNDGNQVSFKLISSDNDTYVFSNPKHDFPTSIVYRYVAPDSIYAHIEGTVKGELVREEFIMKRIK